MAAREIVISLRLSEGSTREQFRALKGALIDVNQEITANNKALKENAKQQKQLADEIKSAGVATEAQAVRERELGERRKELVSESANLSASQASLSAQFREVRNDVAGLTDAHLRFRDKMAQATIEALKQQGVLGQLGARMDFLVTEQDRLNREFKESIITEEKYRQETQKVEQELRELGAQTTQLNGKIDLLTKEFKEGKITAEQFRASVSQINTSVTNVQGSITKGVADLKSYALGFVGVIAVATAAVAAIKSIGNTIADFDQQLANIRSLGKEFAGSIDDISQAAIEMGPKLGVAPVEALKAFEALARAGLTTSQILGGALQSTLTLAAAGTVEVGEAAETTASALKQFNLQGEQAGLVTDLLAKGSNIAQGSVSDFSAALNQSALVAAQFGLTIEETIGGLTAFAQAGLIGSDAGTAFRQALLRLQNPTEKAKDVMAQYGITVTNAAGEFISLEEIAGQLQERLAGLTEEQRGAALATIFGQDAIRVANILYREGAQGIAAYTKEVNESGFASGVATEKLNSLQGSVKQLSGAWDAFVLGIERGDGAIGKFIRVAIDGLRDLLGLLTIDKLESDIIGFGERVRKRFKDIFGKSIVVDVKGDFLNIDKRLPEFEKAFQEEAIKINSILNLQDREFTRSRIAEYAQEAKKLADINEKITVEQKFRLAVIAEAQQALVDGLKEQEKAATAAAQKQVNAANAVADATINEVDALKSASDQVANIGGSVADLNAQIDALKEQQAQSTTSDQFDTYQGQIDKLTQSVDVLTGKLSQDMVDAANEVPQTQPLIPVQATLPTGIPLEDDVERQLALLASQQEFQTQSLDSLLQYYTERELLSLTFTDRERQAFEDLKNAKLDILAAEADALGAFGQTLIALSKDAGAAAKIGLVVEKLAAIASVLISTARGITAAQANADLIPPLLPPGVPNPAFPAAQALAAAQITKLKILAGANIATILAQGFDEGGYTTSGPKHKPAGIVHAGEWVAPKWQVEDPVYGPIIDFLEGQRARRGGMSSIPFAGGGFTQTHGTALVNFGTNPSTGITAQRWSDLQALAIQSAASQQPIFVRVSDINKVQRMGRVTETLATG